jgi:cytochrome c peroxidase
MRRCSRACIAYVLAALFLPDASAYEWNLPPGFPIPRVPAGNPMSAVKRELGRYLFFDKRLSANGEMSCGTCHRPELAFTDGRAFPVGVRGEVLPRSAMSLANVAYSSALMWSNPEVRTLEQQAIVPLLATHPVELGLKGREAAVLEQLRADPVYADLFPKSFPGANQPFTVENIARALATFERTLISGRSPYDRYARGGEPAAISESAKRGEVLFFNDRSAGCYRCHGGYNFSDAAQAADGREAPVLFHNTGLYNLPGTFSYPAPNLGLYQLTGRIADVGKFKAPSLRNIALTGPYMHDGSIATLPDVLDHYEAGGRTIHGGAYAGEGCRNPNKDALMLGVLLTPQQRHDLLAFLESLSDTDFTHDPRHSDPRQH